MRGSLAHRLKRHFTRRRERRVSRSRLLVALGCEEAIEVAGEDVPAPLGIELPTLQYWLADRHWDEWRRHLKACGRVAAVRLAVAAAAVARPTLAGDVIDAEIDETLAELHRFSLRADAASRERLAAKRDVALRIGHDGAGQAAAHGPSAFAHAVANGVHTAFEKDYPQRCRVALWNAFVATWGRGPDDAEFRRALLAAARKSLEPWARGERTDPWPELGRPTEA